MIAFIGLFSALAILIFLTIRGVDLLIAAPITALLVAITGGIAIYPSEAEAGANFVQAYMSGFGDFVAGWFLMFLLGSIFGKLMEDSGAADSVAAWITSHLGMHNAAFAVVIACAILTYGGVSVFIVAFSAYPMALSLFKKANLPRRFIPGVMAFGSVTFTMTSAGSPEIQNWIPMRYLGTTPYAGWEVSLIVAVGMAGFGCWWLKHMLSKAVANGECFDVRENDPVESTRDLPNAALSFLPMLAVLIVTFIFHETLKQYALIAALAAGCLTAWIINIKSFSNVGNALTAGASGALLAIGNTAAVVGFGSVAKVSPAFITAVDAITSMPGNGLVGAAIAVTTIAAITGSALGGQSIALPLLGPHYLEAGVDPEALHRVVSISSGAMDSLPHNGYVVTTIRSICGETHQKAYPPLAALTVVIPVIGTIVAVALFHVM